MPAAIFTKSGARVTAYEWTSHVSGQSGIDMRENIRTHTVFFDDEDAEAAKRFAQRILEGDDEVVRVFTGDMHPVGFKSIRDMRAGWVVG